MKGNECRRYGENYLATARAIRPRNSLIYQSHTNPNWPMSVHAHSHKKQIPSILVSVSPSRNSSSLAHNRIQILYASSQNSHERPRGICFRGSVIAEILRRCSRSTKIASITPKTP
ncbi:hypothetical protein PUN28_016325 [Cardiocondyla obscurior]|uniref:Uncharacterized protein n=1 Tax=Cardiocondyla obscurior TaxID=286306 RepID=A0AAW2ET80_9HYME